MTAPETYLEQQVPDDIAKSWHRWEGAAWRQARYRQEHNEDAPSEIANVLPPEGMCVRHLAEWRRWHGRDYVSPWAGTDMEAICGDDDGQRAAWERTNQSQMMLIEDVCAHTRGCADTVTPEPAPENPLILRPPVHLRIRDCGGPICWCGQPAHIPSTDRRYFPGSSPSAAEIALPLTETLTVAIPLHLEALVRERPDTATLLRRLDRAPQLINAAAETLLGFGGKGTGKAKRRTDAALNGLAFGLAAASMQPGGVHYAGIHWETTAHNPLEEP